MIFFQFLWTNVAERKPRMNRRKEFEGGRVELHYVEEREGIGGLGRYKKNETNGR